MVVIRHMAIAGENHKVGSTESWSVLMTFNGVTVA